MNCIHDQVSHGLYMPNPLPSIRFCSVVYNKKCDNSQEWDLSTKSTSEVIKYIWAHYSKSHHHKMDIYRNWKHTISLGNSELLDIIVTIQRHSLLCFYIRIWYQKHYVIRIEQITIMWYQTNSQSVLGRPGWYYSKIHTVWKLAQFPIRQLSGARNHETTGCRLSGSWSPQLPSWESCNFPMGMCSCFNPMTHGNEVTLCWETMQFPTPPFHTYLTLVMW